MSKELEYLQSIKSLSDRGYNRFFNYKPVCEVYTCARLAEFTVYSSSEEDKRNVCRKCKELIQKERLN